MKLIFPKYVLFGAFGLMLLFVLWNNERFFLDPQAPEWAHYDPIRWHLVPHGTAGFLALALGAAQFSQRIRQHYSYAHRFFGRVYIGATFILAPVAVWMAFITSPWFLIVFTVIQAVTLLIFTLIALSCVLRRDFLHHREWMIRSYSILLIFLEGRVLMAIPVIGRGGMDSIVLVNWACLAVTLVVTEIYLRWREIFPGKTITPRKRFQAASQ
jgi:hypothetical protein